MAMKKKTAKKIAPKKVAPAKSATKKSLSKKTKAKKAAPIVDIVSEPMPNIVKIVTTETNLPTN